jgi:hypothetical protein
MLRIQDLQTRRPGAGESHTGTVSAAEPARRLLRGWLRAARSPVTNSTADLEPKCGAGGQFHRHHHRH